MAKFEAIRDLLRPGLRNCIGRMASHAVPQDDWADIERDADIWLTWWLTRHMDDFKSAFYPAAIEWLRVRTVNPECYVPLVFVDA